mmetsp:Transcript_78150/g.201250  ORF Transcript_78150/g.201250 Transcript_78150/m.201250 type:complete len:225 (-) Transcript_78150:819-1493(-)
MVWMACCDSCQKAWERTSPPAWGSSRTLYDTAMPMPKKRRSSMKASKLSVPRGRNPSRLAVASTRLLALVATSASAPAPMMMTTLAGQVVAILAIQTQNGAYGLRAAAGFSAAAARPAPSTKNSGNVARIAGPSVRFAHAVLSRQTEAPTPRHWIKARGNVVSDSSGAKNSRPEATTVCPAVCQARPSACSTCCGAGGGPVSPSAAAVAMALSSCWKRTRRKSE